VARAVFDARQSFTDKSSEYIPFDSQVSSSSMPFVRCIHNASRTRAGNPTRDPTEVGGAASLGATRASLHPSGEDAGPVVSEAEDGGAAHWEGWERRQLRDAARRHRSPPVSSRQQTEAKAGAVGWHSSRGGFFAHVSVTDQVVGSRRRRKPNIKRQHLVAIPTGEPYERQASRTVIAVLLSLLIVPAVDLGTTSRSAAWRPRRGKASALKAGRPQSVS